MSSPLVLSLFPGLGLLDMAFELEGFCVVRGPDCLWGGDIRRFQPPARRFDGVIGGPPCQSFSSLVHLVRANGHEPKFGNLIPEFERCVVEAQPSWFLMENVPQAPEPLVPHYGAKSFLLDNSAIASDDGMGQEQRRVRRFTFGLRGRSTVPSLLRWIDLAVFLLPDASSHEALTGSHGKPPSARDKVRVPPVTGGHSPPDEVTEWSKQRKRQPTVTSTDGGVRTDERRRHKAVSGSNGGAGSDPVTAGAGNAGKGRYRLADALRLQGLPDDFLQHAPFTADGKLKAVANGVPLMMGRAIARAVMEAVRESL